MTDDNLYSVIITCKEMTDPNITALEIYIFSLEPLQVCENKYILLIYSNVLKMLADAEKCRQKRTAVRQQCAASEFLFVRLLLVHVVDLLLCTK